jgi:predicted enzyme related to lactoylglutathione lyase
MRATQAHARLQLGETTMKAIIAAGLIAFGLAGVAPALAQETGIEVRSLRVLASDPEVLAKFYSAAFGMAETRRPANTDAFREIVLNSGSTPELAKAARSTPIVITTRRSSDPKPGGIAILILQVPDMDAAIKRAEGGGAKLLRPVARTAEGLSYAFLTDPEGNQIELLK